MKSTFFLIAVAASALLAQEPGSNRITIPLSDPSRPAQLRATLMSGGISVQTHQAKEIFVETVSNPGEKKKERPVPRSAQGLKRLDLGSSGDLEVEESNNAVTIHSRHMSGSQELIITVPVNTSLNLKTMNNGDIVVEGVNGELAVNNMNGGVTMRGVSGSVLANSFNGNVTVVMDRVDATKPSSFSTMNGDIDVTLPADTKARVKLKANNGDVFSDFDIKAEPSQSKPVVETGKGRYKVRFDQASFGTINGGGPEFQFSTFNGQIMIRKK